MRTLSYYKGCKVSLQHSLIQARSYELQEELAKAIIYASDKIKKLESKWKVK